MAVGSAHHHGLIYLGSELGGAGTTRPEVVRMAWDGTLRALRQPGVLTAEGRLEAPAAPARLRLLEIAGRDYYVYAPCAGLFEPVRRLGEEVGQGDLLGRIHFVDDPLRAPVAVHFRHAGLFLCVRHPSRVERGDCLAHLGTDLAGDALG